uniref:Solute carrier family 13 member 3 n=1 Tax=Sus scrofa TaxID=9823 RepID=A0A8D0HZ24_PIG
MESGIRKYQRTLHVVLDHTSISKCSLFRNCWFQPLVSAPAQLPCGRPLPIRHPAHGSVLVHRGPAPLSDSPAAHHPLPLLGHPAFQQGLLPVLPGHQLPLPQRSDHGQCHRGMEPAPENCPQGSDVHWGPAGQTHPGDDGDHLLSVHVAEQHRLHRHDAAHRQRHPEEPLWPEGGSEGPQLGQRRECSCCAKKRPAHCAHGDAIYCRHRRVSSW